MATRALICALALLAPAAQAQDRWTGPDKRLHFAYSWFAGMGAQFVIENPHAAVAVALVPGLMKELSDARGGTGFSERDMVWNLIGATAGVHFGRFIATHSDGHTTVAARWHF